MYGEFQKHLEQQLTEIRDGGLYKSERVIQSPQEMRIQVGDGETVLNLCANNYLGLSLQGPRAAAPPPAHSARDRPPARAAGVDL